MTHRMLTYSLLTAVFISVFSGSESFADSGHHFFGGKQVSLPLPASVKPCEKIRAQLYTATRALEAPLGEPVVSDCSKPMQIDLPVVRVKTKLNLEIKSSTPKGWKPAGNISLQVYPQKILSPLREWAQENDLVIADSDGKLEGFLEKQNIPFTANHQKAMKSPAVHVLAGRGEILFKEEADGIPKILIKEKTVLIEMPFLDELPTNPSFQFELLKIFQEIL